MKVLKVNDRVVQSQSNGKYYHNTSLKVGILKDYDGNVVMGEGTIYLTSACVQELLDNPKSGISDIKQLEGHEVRAYRKYPIYLDKFEREYGRVKCDVLIIDK